MRGPGKRENITDPRTANQGAALAASILLHNPTTTTTAHQRNHKGRSHDANADADPPLFRAAVFLCASQPFSISPRAGLDCSADFDLTAAATTISAGAISRSADDVSSDDSSQTASSSEDEVDIDADATVRRFDPSHDPHRIGIPTAHVLGKLDRWAPQGRKLVDLCAEGTAVLFAHRLGHVVPRDAAASAAIAEVVERVAVGM